MTPGESGLTSPKHREDCLRALLGELEQTCRFWKGYSLTKDDIAWALDGLRAKVMRKDEPWA